MRQPSPSRGGLLAGFADQAPVEGGSAFEATSAAPAWVLLADEGVCPPASAPATFVGDLERKDLDRTTVEGGVEDLFAGLMHRYREVASTPGGASWLDVHQAQVRRLLRQAVRKLLALSAWPPFAEAPSFVAGGGASPHVVQRQISATEYRSYTLTWPGVAYVLGAPASAQEGTITERQVRHFPLSNRDDCTPFLGRMKPPPTFAAVSWSTRHAETLQPVLEELARRRRRTLLIDLATDPAQAVSDTGTGDVLVRRLPLDVLWSPGGIGVSLLDAVPCGYAVRVGACVVLLDRLVRVVASVLEESAGATQPSWAAVGRVESLLGGLLAAIRPYALLCCNDTSPLGYIAVRAAEGAGLNTVYVQHGAWIEREIAWRALHSRHIVVMGRRDQELARSWARHPEATIHMLGQPRFDTLATIDRTGQRRLLCMLLQRRCGGVPDRVAIMATQPVSAQRARRQLDAVLEGVRLAGREWGLVVALHPAQEHATVEQLLQECLAAEGDMPAVALAGPGVGARDCLGGADALLSVSSTCGIEALLLDVPVVELALDGEATLGLASCGAAQACTRPAAIAAALNRAATMTPPPLKIKDAVCRWNGHAAADVAELLETLVPVSGTRRP